MIRKREESILPFFIWNPYTIAFGIVGEVSLPMVLHFAIAILIVSKFSKCHPMIHIILSLESLTEDVSLAVDHIKEVFDLHHN